MVGRIRKSGEEMKARGLIGMLTNGFWCVALVCAAPWVGQAQFSFATNNGTLTITGYTGGYGPAVIPAQMYGMPVVSIGDHAFYYRNITSVTIPEGITSIADSAFEECLVLRSLTIPDSVVSIGNYAFATCT